MARNSWRMRASTSAFPVSETVCPATGAHTEKIAASAHERQTMRNEVRKDVRVQHHDHADNRRQRNRMPEYIAEDAPLVADLIGRCRGHADGLCVHHFSH